MAFSRVVFILVCLCASVSGSEHDATPAQPLMETDFESLVRTYVKVEHHNSLLDSTHPLSAYNSAPWKGEFLSLLQVHSKEEPAQEGEQAAQAQEGGQQGGESQLVGACEVCVYVVENKEQHQPYLCRGLKDPNYQKSCVQVMESLMWWLTNEVYWLNYGCQRSMNGAVEWVRPCPAHAVCSWIEELYKRTPFCPEDPYYKKPQ